MRLATTVARVTVAAGAFVDTATVRMVWNVTQLSDLFPLTEYSATMSGGTVYSDLSQAHVDEHAAIATQAWDYLAGVWTASTLTQADFFFTAWSEIWIEYSPFCGGVLLENQTLWQRCETPYPRHFLTPEQAPDFRNILRFLSQEFLRFVYPEAETFPWNAIAGINAGTITTNAALRASILSDTGLTIEALETAYLVYARGL